MSEDGMSASYAQRVGERLRAIRLQKGFSLHDVEDSSGKEFKASVLGAYERGERSISVPRLQRLAIFYGVPVDQLLPKFEDGVIVSLNGDGNGHRSEGGIRIDLTKLRDVQATEADIVSRYVNMIQMQRGDFNGRVLTVRNDDLRALAAVLELTPDGLTGRLDELGVRMSSMV